MFFFDSTCIIVPLFSYAPNVPKILNRVDAHGRIGFYFPVGMLYSDTKHLSQMEVSLFEGSTMGWTAPLWLIPVELRK